MPFSTDVDDPPPQSPAPAPFQLVVPERKPLGAGKAILIFAAYLVSQAVAGGVAMVGYSVLTGSDALLAASLNDMDPVLFLVAGFAGFVLGGPVIVALARAMEGGATWKQALAPFGMVRAPARATLMGAGVGVAIALVLGFGLERVLPSPENAQGPLIEAASAPGWQRILFVLLAVALAPVFEEFLFRGVLYTGMLRSWGKWPAGIIVTLMFGVLHVFDVAGYWPALVMITVVGLALLIARIKSKSLIPAIAMHATYNLVQVVGLYLTI